MISIRCSCRTHCFRSHFIGCSMVCADAVSHCQRRLNHYTAHCYLQLYKLSMSCNTLPAAIFHVTLYLQQSAVCCYSRNYSNTRIQLNHISTCLTCIVEISASPNTTAASLFIVCSVVSSSSVCLSTELM